MSKAITLAAPAATGRPETSALQLGPRLHPIKVLHRHDDGYIAFALEEDDKGFRPAFGIKASALESMFPGFVDRLTTNAYVSINAAYTLAPGKKDRVVGYPRHRTETLRYLCACYCDIDHYKMGLSFHQARQRVLDLCEAGVIPWVSMIVNSGRGMWLLWLLHDFQNPAMAHRGVWSGGDIDSLMVYSQINKTIVSKLQNIGADPQATDGAKYIRMPGSFRTDTETAVWWSIQGSGDAGFSYTLWQLADLLGVKIRRTLPAVTDATRERSVVPGRRSGQIAANKNRLTAMLTLMALRGGGFREPHRDKGAWIYAMCLCRQRVPINEAMRRVREFGGECTPRLSHAQCDAQTRSGYKPTQGRWPYLKIAAVLGVTTAEAEVISQQIGKVFPCSDGTLVEVIGRNGKPKRQDLKALRRLELQRITSEMGHVIPSRKMEVKLRERGFEAGWVTVDSDYRALGYVSARASRLRQGKSNREAQGSLLSPLLGGSDEGEYTLSLLANETEQFSTNQKGQTMEVSR